MHANEELGFACLSFPWHCLAWSWPREGVQYTFKEATDVQPAPEKYLLTSGCGEPGPGGSGIQMMTEPWGVLKTWFEVQGIIVQRECGMCGCCMRELGDA